MMTRRELLSALGRCALGAAAANAAPPACASATRMIRRPVISGALWWLDPAEAARWGEAGWRRELDLQREIGFDLLWLANAPAALAHPADPLKTILDLCAERRVEVILDTGTAPGTWFKDFDPRRELDACGANIARIAGRFGGHPAFRAWYLPHEIYMTWDNTAQFETLYGGLVERCRKAADRPVTLSPFFILDRDGVFGDFRFNEPDAYRDYWAKMIRRTGIDVIMLQDSGEHFSYVTNDQRRPFFRAMRDACRASGARLWGNVETAEFECPSIEENVRRYGRVHHATVKDAPWRPVPLERLKNKLALAAEHCERIVTWGYREYGRPDLGASAATWFREYREYVRAAGGRRPPRGPAPRDRR